MRVCCVWVWPDWYTRNGRWNEESNQGQTPDHWPLIFCLLKPTYLPIFGVLDLHQSHIFLPRECLTGWQARQVRRTDGMPIGQTNQIWKCDFAMGCFRYRYFTVAKFQNPKNPANGAIHRHITSSRSQTRKLHAPRIKLCASLSDLL